MESNENEEQITDTEKTTETETEKTPETTAKTPVVTSIKTDNQDKSMCQLYLSNPVQTKETIGSYTSYTLQGIRITNPITRRYRDFDALRSHLVDRWPGVFIPGMPHKKAVGSNDKEVVDMRIEMLNRFCEKLANIGYIFNEKEMDYFLQEVDDVPKLLQSLPAQSYDDILKKYSAAFYDYEDNGEFLTMKQNQTEFLGKLKNKIPFMRNFSNTVKLLREKYQTMQEGYNTVLNVFQVYEEETLIEYAGKNPEKMVINSDNNQFKGGNKKTEVKTKNPYDKLYDSITGDILDAEAMVEALNSLNSLHETLEKIKKNHASISTQLNELQEGKTNIKAVFRFQSREKNIQDLGVEQEQLAKDWKDLEQVLNLAVWNMEREIKNFKETNLDAYYKILVKVSQNFKENSETLGEFWDYILHNNNIQIEH
jgi:hypothetical protein